MEKCSRLFIAAELPPSFTHELVSFVTALKLSVAANYVSSSNYHVTLAFLGNTPISYAGRISALIDAGAKDGLGEILLGKPGIFGKPDNAILWCGLHQTAPLLDTAANIRSGLDAENISYDMKPVKPHITLARKARTSGIALPSPNALRGSVPAVTLFESTRIDGVLTYVPLYRKKL